MWGHKCPQQPQPQLRTLCRSREQQLCKCFQSRRVHLPQPLHLLVQLGCVFPMTTLISIQLAYKKIVLSASFPFIQYREARIKPSLRAVPTIGFSTWVSTTLHWKPSQGQGTAVAQLPLHPGTAQEQSKERKAPSFSCISEVLPGLCHAKEYLHTAATCLHLAGKELILK